jgi:hypothetical protein
MFSLSSEFSLCNQVGKYDETARFLKTDGKLVAHKPKQLSDFLGKTASKPVFLTPIT